MDKVKQDEKTSLNEEDFTNIKNLFTNTLAGSLQNRSVLRELLNDEDKLIDKLKSIQDERDSLLIENKKLLENVSKSKK